MANRPGCIERMQMRQMQRYQRWNEVGPDAPFGFPGSGYYPGGPGFCTACGNGGFDAGQSAMFGPTVMDGTMMNDGMMMPGPMGMNGMGGGCPHCQQQQFMGPMSSPAGTPMPAGPPTEPTPTIKPVPPAEPAGAMYLEMPQSMPGPSVQMPMQNAMYAAPIGSF
jgi:hypothetical protein